MDYKGPGYIWEYKDMDCKNPYLEWGKCTERKLDKHINKIAAFDRPPWKTSCSKSPRDYRIKCKQAMYND